MCLSGPLAATGCTASRLCRPHSSEYHRYAAGSLTVRWRAGRSGCACAMAGRNPVARPRRSSPSWPRSGRCTARRRRAMSRWRPCRSTAPSRTRACVPTPSCRRRAPARAGRGAPTGRPGSAVHSPARARACPSGCPPPAQVPARADVSLPWPGHGRALTGVLDRPGLKSACRVCRCGLSWRGASADSARTRAQVCRRWKGVLENPAARDVLWRELVVDFGHELITAVHMPIAWCGPRPKCFPEPPPGRPALGCCAARGVRLIHWIRPAHASPDKCTP